MAERDRAAGRNRSPYRFTAGVLARGYSGLHHTAARSAHLSVMEKRVHRARSHRKRLSQLRQLFLNKFAPIAERHDAVQDATVRAVLPRFVASRIASCQRRQVAISFAKFSQNRDNCSRRTEDARNRRGSAARRFASRRSLRGGSLRGLSAPPPSRWLHFAGLASRRRGGRNRPGCPVSVGRRHGRFCDLGCGLAARTPASRLCAYRSCPSPGRRAPHVDARRL